jgi:hypothetical protein
VTTAAFLPSIGLLFEDFVLTAEQGSYSAAGQDQGLSYSADTYNPGPLPSLALLGGLGGNARASDQGSYALTGQDAGLLFGYRLGCDAGFYAKSGQPALFSLSTSGVENPSPLPHLGLVLGGVSGDKTLIADPGAYAIVGSESYSDFEMGSATTTYTITGQDANLLVTRILVCVRGSYDHTGQDAAFTIGSPARTMPAEQGTYSVSGQDNVMTPNFNLACEQGFYPLLGQTAGLAVGATAHYTVLAEMGDYQVFGTDADGVLGDPVLWAEYGTYEVTGYEVRSRKKDDGAGKPKKPKRPKFEIEVDGQVYEVSSKAEAEHILAQLREEAENLARLALERANKAQKRPIRKILKDAEKTLQIPVIEAEESISAETDKVLKDIEDLFNSTLQTIEIAARMRKLEEEEEEAILLMLL